MAKLKNFKPNALLRARIEREWHLFPTYRLLDRGNPIQADNAEERFMEDVLLAMIKREVTECDNAYDMFSMITGSRVPSNMSEKEVRDYVLNLDTDFILRHVRARPEFYYFGGSLNIGMANYPQYRGKFIECNAITPSEDLMATSKIVRFKPVRQDNSIFEGYLDFA